jgi:hypothetical protein
MILNWSNIDYSDGFEVYAKKNWDDEFPVVANYSISEIQSLDVTDVPFETIFYKLAAKKGSSVRYSSRVVGRIKAINPGNWSLISVPVNVSLWELANGTNAGINLSVQPAGCLNKIYRYNESGDWQSIDYEHEGGIWLPATGSEDFTMLEAGKGYYFESSTACNVTFLGSVPTGNLNIPLNSGYNLKGWFSPNTSTLGEEAIYGNPVQVSPADSITYIHRYDPDSDTFELTQYFSGWGYYAPRQYEDFTSLEPTRAYWIETNQECTWEHEP